jgi:hypothetical protein
LEELYEESTRNPGYFIRSLVSKLERQLTETRIFDQLPLEMKTKQKGEENLRSLDKHAIERILWEFTRDVLKENISDLNDLDFSSLFVRSIRNPGNVIEPSLLDQ